MKNKAAIALGKIKSEAKAKAARENGKLGGAPKGNTNARKGGGVVKLVAILGALGVSAHGFMSVSAGMGFFWLGAIALNLFLDAQN